MRKEVENWYKSAKYDLEVAEEVFHTGRYIYVVFFCHLAVEKMLKAVVEKVTGKTPPRTHNLVILLKQAALQPPRDMLKFMGELSETSVATRYPLDFESTAESYTQSAAESCLKQAKEALKWIEAFLK